MSKKMNLLIVLSDVSNVPAPVPAFWLRSENTSAMKSLRLDAKRNPRQPARESIDNKNGWRMAVKLSAFLFSLKKEVGFIK